MEKNLIYQCIDAHAQFDVDEREMKTFLTEAMKKISKPVYSYRQHPRTTNPYKVVSPNINDDPWTQWENEFESFGQKLT